MQSRDVPYTLVRFTDRQQIEADYQFAVMTLEAMRELAHRRQQMTGQVYLLNKNESEIAAQLEHQRDNLYQMMNKEPK